MGSSSTSSKNFRELWNNELWLVNMSHDLQQIIMFYAVICMRLPPDLHLICTKVPKHVITFNYRVPDGSYCSREEKMFFKLSRGHSVNNLDKILSRSANWSCGCFAMRQRTLSYLVRGNITVRLTYCSTGSDLTKQVNLLLIQHM